MIASLLSLHRYQKAVVVALMDTLLVMLALWIAFSLRLGEFYLPIGKQWWLFFCAPLVAVPVFIRLGLYRAVIRYIGHRAMSTIAYANALVAIAWSMLPFYLSNFFNWDLFSPRSLPFIFWMVLCILIGGSRQMFRWFVAGAFRRKGDHYALIYGAGEAGYKLASSLMQSSNVRMLGFIDDNPALTGQQIADLPVLGGADKIESLSEEYDSLEVLLAMPALTAADRRRILHRLEQVDVIVRSIPSLDQIVLGKADLTSLNEVQLEDLLGRAPIEPDPELLEQSVKGRVVLVSGAGGSIGSELCRQLLLQQPARLLLLEQNEFGLYQIEAELEQLNKHYCLAVELIPVLGSVIDASRMLRVLADFDVEVVFHAAAYKHVPIVEQNVIPGVRNNVLGTWELASAAMNAGVSRFVLVSTDKAVRPTNIMGASKRLAEMVLQGLQQHPSNQGTCFVMVRFGNVIGSSGSVIPLFRKQIEQGGPVTVTDQRITRYFMTIPEAASLVIQAGAMGQGGELYVLDMGEPVKIDDLARRMIRLSGYRVQPEGELGIEIRYTGLRPGEKLFEELLIGDDVSVSGHERIWVANEAGPDASELDELVGQVQELVSRQDVTALRQLMLDQVSGFKPQCDNQDLLDHVR